MEISKERYEVANIVEAQKIASDLKANLIEILKNYYEDKAKQGELLYAILTQASNVNKFIVSALDSGLDSSKAMVFYDNIREGINYLEKTLDTRIINGSTYEEPYDPEEETFWNI